jgi:hypothetical protein
MTQAWISHMPQFNDRNRNIKQPALIRIMRVIRPHRLCITGAGKMEKRQITADLDLADLRVALALLDPSYRVAWVPGHVGDSVVPHAGRQMFRHFSCTASSASILEKFERHPQPPHFFLWSF